VKGGGTRKLEGMTVGPLSIVNRDLCKHRLSTGV
jgi:hypothetical protein